MSETQPETFLTGPRRAPRGSSCLVCRRRKYKCDSVKPVCGPCGRINRTAECTYEEGPRPSRKQLLEEELIRLEGRVRELEQPQASSSSVQLHHPHVTHPREHPSSSVSEYRSLSTAPAVDPSLAYLIQASNNLSEPLFTAPEPSPAATRVLIDAFLMHANQVGFFLHRSRFLQAALEGQLSPALLNAVYLWGVHLSQIPALAVYEPVFISRARRALASAIAHMPAYNITHTIQAEVLVANYYFLSGRLLDGHRHCNSAVALALSCKLHCIRSLRPSHATGVDTMEFDLPLPNDALEEGERIHAFWTVYVLHNCWSTSSKSLSRFNLSNNLQIDTPWPIEIDEYAAGNMPASLRTSRTVDNFLRGIHSMSSTGTSSMTLLAKAAALLESAAALASRQSSPANIEQVAFEFVNLDNTIDRFIISLTLVEMAPIQEAARLLLTHTLVRVATIQLHTNFKQTAGLVESKDVVAAKAAAAVLDNIDVAQLAFVDSFFAVLWSIVSRVLIDEMSRLRSLWMSMSALDSRAHGLQYVRAEYDSVVSSLTKLTAVMSTFGRTSPLMATHAGKIQHEIAQANRQRGAA